MENAFEKLRKKIARNVVLAYPDYAIEAKMLELYRNASEYSMRECLMQDKIVNKVGGKRVIAYK